MRKLAAVLLTLSLLLGLVSTAFARDYTLDIYWIGNRDDEEIRKGVEQAVSEYVEPKIRAKVAFHIINWDDWTEQALGPLLADEKIDLIFTADWRDYVLEILAGKLLQLDDQLETNGQGIMETLPQALLDGARFNGALYGIPTNKELCVPSGLIVNRTAAGLIGWDPEKDPVRTTEELEPYLEKYKKMFPGRYPYLMEKDRWADEPWNHEWIAIEGDAIDMKYAMDENGEFDETVYSIYETEEQEEHIRLMHRWAEAGYISPDAAKPDFDYNKVFGTGDFLVFTQPLKGNNFKSVEMYEANKEPYVPDFECTEIIMQDRYLVTCQAGGSMFAIPKTGKAKAAMKYLNLMHSDATLVNLMLFGREGVNYRRVNDQQVELIKDANWYGLHGGAWTVGNTKLQYVLATEDPEKNALLQSFADGAPKTASYGFRFNKSTVQETVDAVTEVVKKYARPLMVGAVDPDDPELGLRAFRKALKDAGIDDLKAEVEAQYTVWKESQK